MKTLICLLSVVLSLRPVYCASVDDLLSKSLGAVGVVEVAIGSDTKLARVWYVGSASEAYLAISGNILRASAPAGTNDGADFGIGEYRLNVSSTNTLGEICTTIDALTDYECELLAGRPGLSANFLRDASITASSDLKSGSGYTIRADSATEVLSLGGVSTFVAVGMIPHSDKSVRLRQCIVQSVGPLAKMRVYGKLKIFEQVGNSRLESPLDGATRNNDTVADEVNLVANAASTVTWAVGGQGGLDFAEGSRVVVEALTGDTGGTNQTINSFVNCVWEER